MARQVQVYRQATQPSGAQVGIGDIWIQPGAPDLVYICNQNSPGILFSEVDNGGGGSGTGNVTATLTTNKLPIATAAHTLGDSLISQSGSVATITGKLHVTTAGAANSIIYTDGSGNLVQSDNSGNTNFLFDPNLQTCKGTALCLFVEALPVSGTAGITGIGAITFIDTADTFPANQSYIAGAQFGASHGGTGNITPNVNGGLVGMTAFATVGGSGSAAEAAGMFSQMTLNDDDGGGGNITTASAISAIVPSNYSAAGVITTGYGLWLKDGAAINGTTATGHVTTMKGIQIDTQTSQQVTTLYGAFIGAQSLGATTNIGLHIGNISGGATTNRAIETGTGLVHFGDNVESTGTMTVGTRTGTPATVATFDSGGKLVAQTGTTTTVTTASLSGKTMTFTNGVLTGFA